MLLHLKSYMQISQVLSPHSPPPKMWAGPVCGLSPPRTHQADHLHHQHHYQQSASIGLSSVGIISFAQTIRFGKEISAVKNQHAFNCFSLSSPLFSSQSWFRSEAPKRGLLDSLIFNSFNWTTNYLLSHSFLLRFSLFPSIKAKIVETKSHT